MTDTSSAATEALVSVIWFDEHLVVANKPAGLPTLPDGYDRTAPHLAQVLSPQFGRLWIVHRLDRGTSGAIILARNVAAHRALNLQFDSHAVRKTYHALAVGEPPWDEYTVRLPLRPDGDRKHRTVIDPQRGKPAATALRLLQSLDGFSLMEARPETGRTHQIRAHLAHLQLPLLGDVLYGGAATTVDLGEGTLIGRPALHAAALAFAHPATGAALSFEAPYPSDFTAALLQLRTRRDQRSGGSL